MCGHDAPFLERLMKGLNLPDDMVGRHDQKQGIVMSFKRLKRRQGNGRRRIAARRLQQNTAMRHIELAQLLGDQKTVHLVADHNGRTNLRQSFKALERLL